jgi:hypothetical protein
MDEQLPEWMVAMQSFGWESMVQVLVAALLGGAHRSGEGMAWS